MSSPIETGKGTGNYKPSLHILEVLARQPKNRQQSLYGWSKELGHDESTVRKILEKAMEPGILAAYGGDPRAKIERVEVCRFEYTVDPEPQSLDEQRFARENCEAIASQQENLSDWIIVEGNCWDAFGDSQPGEDRTRAPEAATKKGLDWSYWPLLLSLGIPAAIVGGWVLSELFFPRSSPASPPRAPSSKPEVAEDPFDLARWVDDSFAPYV